MTRGASRDPLSLPNGRILLRDHLARKGKLVRASALLLMQSDHVEPHHGDVNKFWLGPFQSLCKGCHESTKRTGCDGGWALQEKPDHLAVNGDQVIAQSKAAADLRTTVTTGKGPGGIRYTCTLQMDENGRSVLEQWVSSYGLSAGSLRRQWRTLTPTPLSPKSLLNGYQMPRPRAGH